MPIHKEIKSRREALGCSIYDLLNPADGGETSLMVNDAPKPKQPLELELDNNPRAAMCAATTNGFWGRINIAGRAADCCGRESGPECGQRFFWKTLSLAGLEKKSLASCLIVVYYSYINRHKPSIDAGFNVVAKARADLWLRTPTR